MSALVMTAKDDGVPEDNISEGCMPIDQPTRPLLDPDTPDWFVHFADTWFMSLAKDVAELKEAERRNNKLLRGENGTQGIVSRFDFVEKRVDGLFSTGGKVILSIALSVIGLIFFLITTVLGIILYHVLTTP